MRSELGDKWKSKFKEFDMRPIAAASIGQVRYQNVSVTYNI
jgi:predicted unusual protein kinase regulating ubiquinone biosynthesis (AarF/ABC1/UbiB family)